MSGEPLQQPRDVAAGYAAQLFLMESVLKRVQTAAPVKVVAVTVDGEVGPVGRVDVVPLINQVTGTGQTVPHATVFNVPYSRWQGGANAVIMDPQVGDIGVCVFAARDISALKSDPAGALGTTADGYVKGAPPGSARTYDFSDAIYVGGILNGTPEQFVQFSADGIRVFSPTKVTIEAPSIEFKGPVSATSTITAVGDVEGAGVSLQTHVHPGVTSGGASTGPPTP